MTNPELDSQTPTTNEFLSNPAGIAQEIERALKSGLAPQFVEANLKPILEEARNVNSINEQTDRSERELENETLKQNLLVKLATFDGNKATLSDILNKFCTDNGIALYPEAGWNVPVRNEVRADWFSADGKFALTVDSSSIYLYKKIGNKWSGEALDSMDI